MSLGNVVDMGREMFLKLFGLFNKTLAGGTVIVEYENPDDAAIDDIGMEETLPVFSVLF